MFELIDFLIVRPLVNILFVIYNLVGDFGLAIIIFTVIVKLAMWPLMNRQLEQTKLMRKIQPQLAEIKKNCKGNRQLESIQMMDLYKRNNIKPFRSILTLIIQLPIFIALFTAINVMVTPRPDTGSMCGYTNVSHCAYEPVANLSRIQEIAEKQDTYLAEKAENENAVYDFSPKLFNLVDLNATASGVFAGGVTVSEVIILLFAVAAAFLQYIVAKQQQPSKNKKRKTFKQMMNEAKEGQEPDQEDLNAMMSSQMGFMMPLMMFLIMFNLPGALAFYYLLTNVITVVQQKIIFDKSEKEMEISADKAVIKELNKIQEAEVIENKKTGTRITRISAKGTKPKKDKKSTYKTAEKSSHSKKKRRK